MTDTLRHIKQDLHAMMNGVASAVMRDAGMTQDYRTNFGVELPRLQTMAEELRHDHAQQLAPLAQALWKESVRECRILGLMLFPPAEMDGELAEVWLADIHTLELVQVASLHLFSHMPKATDKAFEWMAAESELVQMAGYYTIGHILRTHTLNDRAIDELRDQATAALASENTQLRMAAQRALARLSTD